MGTSRPWNNPRSWSTKSAPACAVSADTALQAGHYRHPPSWAKFTPIDHNSAGRKKGGGTGKGNPWLAGTLGEVVAALARTDTFLGERYRHLARRRGKKRAIVAVGNSVLTVVWHLLNDPAQHYQDLGSDFYESRINKRRRERDLIRQLEHLTGRKVTLTQTAA